MLDSHLALQDKDGKIAWSRTAYWAANTKGHPHSVRVSCECDVWVVSSLVLGGAISDPTRVLRAVCVCVVGEL